MRSPILTKTALLAAGLFSAAALSSFAETYNPNKTDFAQYVNNTIEVNTSTGQKSISGQGPRGSGKLIVRGGNTLELELKTLFYEATPSGPSVYLQIPKEGETTAVTSVGLPVWTGGELVVEGGSVSMRGCINLWEDYGSRINSFLLADDDSRFSDGGSIGGRMSGVSAITLKGTSRLDVGESVLDPIRNPEHYPIIEQSQNYFVFLNNLRAGESNDQNGTLLNVGTNNANYKLLNARYHVDLHVDAFDSDNAYNSNTGIGRTLADGGSIGRIVGDAYVYKTGGGKFNLLGESSQFTGAFYAAGGSLILSAPSVRTSVDNPSTGALASYYASRGEALPQFGRTLWAAESLTIAGTVDSKNSSYTESTTSLSEASRQGAAVRVRLLSSAWNENEKWNRTYFEQSGFTTPAAGTVVVNDNQAIRNFQAMFANGASATDSNKSAASAIQNAADNVDKDAPIIAGTGAGSYLAVKEGATLAIYQEAGKGGIYKGTICGVNAAGDAAGVDSVTGALTKGGTIVKYGAGDLALMLEGSNYEKLVILEGRNVVVNIQALDLDPGSYDFTKPQGEWIAESGLYVSENVSNFTIVENVGSTLKIRLDSANVHFRTYAMVSTLGGEMDVGEARTPGYVEIATEQRFVSGEVFAENGMTLILTATDFAGENVDTDGDDVVDVRCYYDKNGAGTVTDEDGEHEITRVEKDLDTGKRVFYYMDNAGNEQRLVEGTVTDALGVSHEIVRVETDSATGRRVFYYRDTFGYEWSLDEDSCVFADYEDSITFSGGSFGNASAVILSGRLEGGSSSEAIYSTLAFNNTDQRLNNLAGDVYSEVKLGTSTLTLNITDSTTFSGTTSAGTSLRYSTFDGAISGVGNLVKTGAETLTLGGGKSLSYSGATVISAGAVSATKAGSLWDSSAVILNKGTSAAFKGAQNLVTLFGASDSAVTLDNGELRLGADATRRNLVDAALSGSNSLGFIVTDDFGNSSAAARTFSGSANSESLVAAYLRPFSNLAASASDATRAALQTGVNDLATYLASGDAAAAGSVRVAFGLGSSSAPLTKAEITRIYMKLLQANGLLAQSGTADSPSSTDAMIERLSFDGSVSAKSILKIGDDRATLSGKVEAETLTISSGVLEIDADAPASANTFSKGVTIAQGATFAINTAGVVGQGVFDKMVSGDGNFEKLGEGDLVLGANVVYYGTTTVRGGNLTMTLRSTAGGVYSQGDVIVENADSTLTFRQTADTLWNGKLTNAGDLVKTGAGALEMRGEGSSLAGGVAVEGGSLLLADVEISGVATETVDPETGEVSADNAVSVAADTTLTLEQTADATVNRAFVGTGTIVKAGEGKLTLKTETLRQPGTGDVENFGAFAGEFRVEGGTAVLATKNLFAKETSAVVAEGATLTLTTSQMFSALSGDGNIYLNAENIALTLNLANEDKIYVDNGSGVYRTRVNGDYSTDYSEFKTYSGKISSQTTSEAEFVLGGAGSLVFSGVVGNENSPNSNIQLSVKDGAALITSVLNRKINDVSDSGCVVLAYSGERPGEFSGDVLGDPGRTLGKIGTGTLIMPDAKKNSWSGANLHVYEGTLELQGTSAFDFGSAVVVEGSTLSLEYTGVGTDLSKIEGSGTISLIPSDSQASGILEIGSTTMLTPDSGAAKYFNGKLDAGSLRIRVTGTDVELCSIETTGGFDSEGKVKFYQAQDSTIGGSFSGNVEVTGAGVLTIEDVGATGTILVNDGRVRIDAAAEGLGNSDAQGLRVKNDATIYFTNTNSQENSGRLSGVELRGAVTEGGSFETLGKIELIKTGAELKELNFYGDGREQLNVEQELWNVLTGENRGNASLSVGVNEGTLRVSGLNVLDSEVGLVVYGEGTFEVHSVREQQNLNRSISGDGSVAFSGDKTTTVSADQAYTGETTIEGGASVKFDGVALATSKLTVNGSMTGGVRLVGSRSRDVSLNTRVLAEDAASGVSGGDFVNYGTVTLNVSAGDRIEYAGTFDNRLGTIRLTGASATKRGYEIVLFKSLSGTKMTSEQLTANFGGGRLTNGSSALMLAQTSDGVLSAFSLGESFGLTEGLHDGLSGSFTAVLDELGGLDDVGDYGIVIEDDLLRNADGSVNIGGVIGSALNRDSAARLADDVANLSPIGFASMIALPRSSFANDVRAISERASHRRFDSTNEIYDNGAEFFARAQSTLRDGSKEADGANFDFNTYGVLVGADVKPDDYSLYGVAVGYDYGSATLHGGGGKIRSDGLRATAFFSSLLGDGTFFADAGAQVGVNRFETDRSTLVGKADGDADGWNVGAFANFGKGIELSKGKRSRLLATPYVGLEYLYSRVGSFDENGVAGLDVDSFDANSLVGRLGVVFDWQFQLGDWEARLSLGAAYAHEFLDDEADVDASFRRVADSKFRATGTIGAADTFSLAPSLTIDLSERNSLQFGYVLEYGTDEQLSHNFNAGFRRTF